jgi:hypothetical protein
MRSAFRTLAAACAALPLLIAMASAPASAAPACDRMLSVNGTAIVVHEGEDLVIPIIDQANCPNAGSVQVQAMPATGPHGEPPTPNDGDYDGTVHTVPWSATDSSQLSVPIQILADAKQEGNEYFKVKLISASGKAEIVGGLDERMVRIAASSDEPTVSFPEDGYGCMIGACCPEIRGVGHLIQPVEIYWKAIDITAYAGKDYRPVGTGHVTMLPGTNSVKAQVDLLPTAQPGRYFMVEIVRVTGAALGGRTTAIMTIK